ncbi:DUF1501 domain-containing protein [Planktomarina temperata]|jgi:uncharacterized protein (DUF1501 family)|nr:DUF1501 domain-containing protein [Planktomarina temperata]
MMLNRRKFVSFLGSLSVFSMSPSLLTAANSSSKFLILVELQGANDGLNTVIPYKRKQYYKLRPSIAINSKDILTITKDTGFHPSFVNIAKLFERGECKVVEGLGYPQPILSHFESIERWERGGDGLHLPRNGWLIDPIESLVNNTRYDAKAMFLDDEGAIFHGGDEGYLGPKALNKRFFDDLENINTLSLASPNSTGGLLKTLQTKNASAKEAMKRLNRKLDNVRRNISIKGGDLGMQLSQVCAMVEAGIDMPVFKVSIGSFDTHDNQPREHARLLSNLDYALSDTVEFLKSIGRFQDAIIMTYSEFGRRARENGSSGTDHGMAAPHLVLGGKVNGGLYGKSPSLSNLDHDNLLFTTDYRSLYNMILSEHFSLKTNPFEPYKYTHIV